ncbi:MAG: cytochrome d ubiquinol oxidase subunit II, partial [Verrucomicrobiota bacterium]|nr:cytochrome d ubiquinol oxidase subunit II [Verrucomicrobiota bacterium]
MIALQITWLLLIGVLLIGYAVLDGFDLGVGVWHLFAKKGAERDRLIRSIEPHWDGNEVWLLTGGGALFAAFPPVYATVFSGFYLALMLVLLGLILRAVSIEFRHRVADPRWVAVWDAAFAAGSVLPSLLYAVAVGNVLRGLPLNAAGDYTGGF